MTPSQPILELVCDAIPLDAGLYDHLAEPIEAYSHDAGYREALLAVAARAEELKLPRDTVLALMRGGIVYHEMQGERREG